LKKKIKEPINFNDICPSCIGFGEERSSNGYGKGYSVIKCKDCNGKGVIPAKSNKLDPIKGKKCKFCGVKGWHICLP
jgi:DnaJ-class molecular chaperone